MTKAGQTLARSFRACARALTAGRGAFLRTTFSTFGKAIARRIGRTSRPRVSSAAFVKPPIATLAASLIRAAMRQVTERLQPQRPAFFGANRSGMCEAQRLDLKAAQDGKITWRQYFAMWGGLGL